MIGPLGMQEMLIILVVALIVFGPRKLPQIGKTLGRSIAEFRRTSNELRSTLEREVQMEEFRAARNEVSKVGKDIRGGLDPGAGRGPHDPGPARSDRKSPPGGDAAAAAEAGGGTAAETPAGQTERSESRPKADTAAPEAVAAERERGGGE